MIKVNVNKNQIIGKNILWYFVSPVAKLYANCKTMSETNK